MTIRLIVRNVSENRLDTNEGIEVTEPRTFRQSGKYEDLALIKNIDLIGVDKVDALKLLASS